MAQPVKQKTRKLAEAYMGGLITRREYYLIQARRDKKKVKKKAAKERAMHPTFTSEDAKGFAEYLSIQGPPKPNVFRHYEQWVPARPAGTAATADAAYLDIDYFLKANPLSSATGNPI